MTSDPRQTVRYSPNILVVEWVPIDSLRPPARRPRAHSKTQIRQIANSIEAYGFNTPLLTSDELRVHVGIGRWEAAKLLGLERVPIVKLSHLDPIQLRAYAIADNKLTLNSEWCRDLALEIQDFIDVDLDVAKLGFLEAEIDFILDAAQEAAPGLNHGPEDDIRSSGGLAITKAGDLWIAGRHRLLCGNALTASGFNRLMQGERADLVFADVPYNVPIHGHVTGHGRVRHREFAMATGEMSASAYTSFLRGTFSNVIECSKDGAIAFICNDWRHMVEISEAASGVFGELKNLCIWNKTNGGMGSFYRSKHELIFVFKVGTAPHTNTFGLGNTGRYRTNVWDYAGVNTFKSNRDEELAMHPTVKPVALVADAIKDCSRRGEIVLDPFAGSGTTLVAAEKTGRRARLMEIDPIYCDCIIQRYQRFTGESVTLAATGQRFEEISEERLAESPFRETADV
jgi:DNA modification methylase